MKNTPAENWHKIGAPMPMTSEYKSGIMVSSQSGTGHILRRFQVFPQNLKAAFFMPIFEEGGKLTW